MDLAKEYKEKENKEANVKPTPRMASLQDFVSENPMLERVFARWFSERKPYV